MGSISVSNNVHVLYNTYTLVPHHPHFKRIPLLKIETNTSLSGIIREMRIQTPRMSELVLDLHRMNGDPQTCLSLPRDMANDYGGNLPVNMRTTKTIWETSAHLFMTWRFSILFLLLLSGDITTSRCTNTNGCSLSSFWPDDLSVFRPTVRTDVRLSLKSSSSSRPKLMSVAAF